MSAWDEWEPQQLERDTWRVEALERDEQEMAELDKIRDRLTRDLGESRKEPKKAKRGK
jgi:hypothetical protein